jgi:hypothetical protein
MSSVVVLVVLVVTEDVWVVLENTFKMKYETFQKLKNLRPIRRDELVLDCDDRESGDLKLRQLGLLFSADGYRLEVWKAEGQKSYHIHIKNIPHIAELSKEQNRKYKELLLKKYIRQAEKLLNTQPEYFEKVDFVTSCTPDHLLAEENKPHFKYNTVKKLLAVFNEDYENFCDMEVYRLTTMEKQEYKPTVKGSGITAKIIQNISIIDIAKKFGLEVNNQGFAICPFHPDSNPSLKFYESQGRFICFGCRTMGNIIVFYALMKKLRQGEISK